MRLLALQGSVGGCISTQPFLFFFFFFSKRANPQLEAHYLLVKKKQVLPSIKALEKKKYKFKKKYNEGQRTTDENENTPILYKKN